MEIKTCEQYVLAELEARNAYIEKLKDNLTKSGEAFHEQLKTIGKLVGEKNVLNAIIDRLLNLIEIVETDDDFKYLKIDVFGDSDEFDFVERLKKEREPNAEADDSKQINDIIAEEREQNNENVL